MANYRTKVLARLNDVLDKMAGSEPEDLRNLALAAKSLADIEQGARGGSNNTTAFEQLVEAALKNGSDPTVETKIPEHLQETQEEQE